MSKFLPINDAGEMLNADLIAHIIPEDDGGCVVVTKDGQRFYHLPDWSAGKALHIRSWHGSGCRYG